MALIPVTSDTMHCYKADNSAPYYGDNGGQIDICRYDDSYDGIYDTIVINIDSSIPIDAFYADFQDSSLSNFFDFYASDGNSWSLLNNDTYGIFSAPSNQDLQNVTFEMRLKDLFKNNYQVGDLNQNFTPWLIADQNNNINSIFSMPFFTVEQIPTNQVPEPSAAALMGIALMVTLATKKLFRR